MMLAENIKKYRKANNMSQDELAQRLDVTRQSVSLWENGQSQPTIDNIIALTKIFGISSDELLDTVPNVKYCEPSKEAFVENLNPHEDDTNNRNDWNNGSEITHSTGIANEHSAKKKNKSIGLILIIFVIIAILLTAVLIISKPQKAQNVTPGAEESITESTEVNTNSEMSAQTTSVNEKEVTAEGGEDGNTSVADESAATDGSAISETPQAESSSDAFVQSPAGETTDTDPTKDDETPAGNTDSTQILTTGQGDKNVAEATTAPENHDFSLFDYCRDFSIEKGHLNGDYCMYQQPSTRYGGYEDEYFSVSYWADSNMVEFCLHCPLSDTQSINFYLRMRDGYDGKYEYLTSRYYRSDGSSIRSAGGYIDPAVFSEKYPLSCDYYDGSADGQTEFMEESRVGMCDLIKCLKQFVKVENMECNFSDFDFVNF